MKDKNTILTRLVTDKKKFECEVSVKLEKSIKHGRKSGSYWYYPVQWAEEYGVVKVLLEEMSKDGNESYYNPQPLNKDERWPDCVVKDQQGKSIAVEVTEFVDERVVGLNQRAKKDEDMCYRKWTDKAVVAKLTEIIRKKDTVSHGGKYAGFILVIHCDEFALTSCILFPTLERTVFPQMKNIQKVFLICSHEPKLGGGRHPYRELRTA